MTSTSRRIIAQRLGVTFPDGQTTLSEIDFRGEPGEFVSILGPSGCGKSTFLRCVAGLQEPTTGTLLCEDDEAAASRIAFVFQDPNLLPWRNVHQNVGLPLELERQSSEQIAVRASDAIQLVGLEQNDSSKLPHMLSGGMRMRVSLARALVTDPHVLLLDEPFAALDEISRQMLNEELLRLWQQQGWTTLFVTHNVTEAVFLSQRVIVMSRRPATIIDEFAIDFDQPRDAEFRGTPAFAETTRRVSAALRGAMS